MIQVRRRVHKKGAALTARLREYLGDRDSMFAVRVYCVVLAALFPLLMVPPRVGVRLGLWKNKLRKIRWQAPDGSEKWPVPPVRDGDLALAVFVFFAVLALLCIVFVMWDIDRGIREDERDGSSEW